MAYITADIQAEDGYTKTSSYGDYELTVVVLPLTADLNTTESYGFVNTNALDCDGAPVSALKTPNAFITTGTYDLYLSENLRVQNVYSYPLCYMYLQYYADNSWTTAVTMSNATFNDLTLMVIVLVGADGVYRVTFGGAYIGSDAAQCTVTQAPLVGTPGIVTPNSTSQKYAGADASGNQNEIAAIQEWVASLLEGGEEDPFAPGGTTGDDESDSEGGDGNFENEEVTVDPPALPSLSAITSGFISAYMPTFAQLQSLGDYLWSDLFSLDTFKKLFSDPMQAILGLSLVPVTPSTNDGYVVIGNVNTNIIMPRVMQQFVTVDCGSITLPEYWGGYLDYSPYTKVEIYLPYIGVRPLDTDEVMGKTLHVVYHVDVLSGACVCFIQCDNTIRYHYVGQCGASIPITANDWTRVVNGAVSIATALGVGVATLGAGAAAGGVTAASMAGAGALVGGVASQVLASKPRVEHSGSLAGMGGLLGVQFPYIMIQRPRQAVPSGQNAFTGYPSFIKRTLSTVTGYTQVTGVHLTGLSCTDEEKKEIQAYLEAGVIL